jgi:hypothetical protein
MREYTLRFRLRMLGEPDDVEWFAKQLAADLIEKDGVLETWVLKPVERRTAGGRPAHDREAAERWLVNYLRHKRKPMPTALVYDAAEQAGISRRTLRRAADSMHIVRHPKVGGPKTTWALPEEARDAA